MKQRWTIPDRRLPAHQIPIWPGAAPDLRPVPGPETVTLSEELLAGKPVTSVTNVTRPTTTVYAPEGKSTGAAVLVIPGGGFEILAMDFEGTEICDWLTSKGITCVLLKYRVPSEPYLGKCACRPRNLSTSVPSLQDIQRAMPMVRFHAAQWHIDSHKVGVLGFSAGGYLVGPFAFLCAARSSFEDAPDPIIDTSRDAAGMSHVEETDLVSHTAPLLDIEARPPTGDRSCQ